MAQDAPDQVVASTSAPSGMEETEEPQLILPLLLDTIIKSYESHRIQLANACWQVDEVILGAKDLTDLQRNALHDRYTASIEDAVTRHVLAIGQGHREEAGWREATPREAGDEAAEPPRMSGGASQEGGSLPNLR